MQPRPRLWPRDGGDRWNHDDCCAPAVVPQDPDGFDRAGQGWIIGGVGEQEEERAGLRLLDAGEEIFAGRQQVAREGGRVEAAGRSRRSRSEGDEGPRGVHVGSGNTPRTWLKAPLLRRGASSCKGAFTGPNVPRSSSSSSVMCPRISNA